jgi:tripartite-type tricarboxylate transporter receptor subunit TctC
MKPGHRLSRWISLSLILATILAAACGAAIGQAAYPAKPIRLVVPMPPGGGTDAWARLIADKMGTLLGQPILVDNRPGAGTMIGAELVAKSAADGYTLLIGDIGTYAVNPNLYKKTAYDPAKDFTPITLTSRHLLVLAVPANSSIDSLSSLIARARAQPGVVSYGSASVGSPHHLAMELFQKAAGIRLNHAPYKGGAPLAADMVGGQLDVAFMDLPSALPHLQSGKLRGLALVASRRVQSLPQLPTMKELGFPRFEVTAWQGLVAPAGTARDIVAKLGATYARVSQDPEVRQKLDSIGIELTPGSPEEFGAYMQSESGKWGALIREKGISAD